MATICPKDSKPCIDDICRGSGICGMTGLEMWDQCDRCHALYSYEFGVECECDRDYDDDDEPFVAHDCGDDACCCDDKES